MPKISVIIPVYNVANYIERCARSLFEQTLDDMEFIFVDDASSDDSVQILQETLSHYSQRKSQVHIIHHSSNQGQSTTRDSGLQVARGDFIAYCDSDDYVTSNMYKSLYEKAIKEKADIVYCDFFMEYSSHNEYYKTLNKNEDKIVFLKKYLSQNWNVLWNMIISRELLLAYNLQSPQGITYCEDFYLTVRILFYANKIAKINDALYYYNRANNSSIMHKLSEKNALDERNTYLDTIEFFAKNGVLTNYQREMSWRILKNKQDLVLNPHQHYEFMNIYPESHKYIMSCPVSFCNRKIKCFMWMLTHHLHWPLLGILYLRKTFGK